MDLFGEPDPPPQEEEPQLEGMPEQPEVTEDFAHPRHAQNLIGHEAVEENLKNLFASGRMPHGLIFSGPKGIGKATLAYTLTRHILSQGKDEKRVSSQIASGGHPDLLTIERAYDATTNKTAAGVAVADIRKVAPFLRMTASDGGWRVVILDDADTMNRSAQNALLKILEEPPKNTLLILIAHRLGALIPTIRSRTQTIHLTAPDESVFTNVLSSKAGPEDLKTLYAMTSGSIGAALDYIENEELESLNQLLNIFKQYPNWSWPEIHKLGDELARAVQDKRYQSFVFSVLWIYRQMTTAKARGYTHLTPEILNAPALDTLLKQSSLESLLETCDKLSVHFGKIDRANLDKRQGVLGAFTILAA